MRVRLITNCGRRKLNIELIEIDIERTVFLMSTGHVTKGSHLA